MESVIATNVPTLTADSDSSSFEKPTPTPDSDSSSFKKPTPTPAENMRLHRLHNPAINTADMRNNKFPELRSQQAETGRKMICCFQ